MQESKKIYLYLINDPRFYREDNCFIYFTVNNLLKQGITVKVIELKEKK